MSSVVDQQEKNVMAGAGTQDFRKPYFDDESVRDESLRTFIEYFDGTINKHITQQEGQKYFYPPKVLTFASPGKGSVVDLANKLSQTNDQLQADLSTIQSNSNIKNLLTNGGLIAQFVNAALLDINSRQEQETKLANQTTAINQDFANDYLKAFLGIEDTNRFTPLFFNVLDQAHRDMLECIGEDFITKYIDISQVFKKNPYKRWLPNFAKFVARTANIMHLNDMFANVHENSRKDRFSELSHRINREKILRHQELKLLQHHWLKKSKGVIKDIKDQQ